MLAAFVTALAMCATASGSHNVTAVVSTGPAGGNGAVSSQFRGASADGSRIFFQSNEALVAADTDTRMDIYERSGSTTTLLSTGPAGGNGAFNASFAANSADGTRVFFRTSEQLVSGDTDTTQDLYERFNGTTTLMSTGPAGGNGHVPGDLQRDLPGRLEGRSSTPPSRSCRATRTAGGTCTSAPAARRP